MAELIKRPDFFIIPSVLIEDERLRPIDGLVYGAVYWYKRLKNERCTASNSSIASLVRCTNGTVTNALVRLNKYGYVEVRVDPKTQHRIEIIPLVAFSKIDPASNDLAYPTSNDLGGVHQMIDGGTSNDVHNKNIEEEKENNTSPTPQEVIGSPTQPLPPITAESAGNNYRIEWDEFFKHYQEASGSKTARPLASRFEKFKTRRLSFTLDQMKDAVTNCFQDSWFSGNNDRGWKADIDYILRNDEKLEKLLYLKPRSSGGKIFGAV